jgi:predicted dehydrogenase
MADKVRILVAGAGRFGREHLRTLAAMEGVALVGVADVDERAAREAAQRFGASAWERDAAALIDRLRPDGVVVATPGVTHVALATRALATGASVLVEKPVAVTAADAATLAAAAAKGPGFVLPGHILRFSGPHRTMAEIVRSGEIGDVLTVVARRHRDDSHAACYVDDPVLMTMIHDIDLAIWITDASAVGVHALRAPAGEVRSSTMMMARDTKGSTWHLSTAWTYPGMETPPDRLEIVGTQGGVELEVGVALRQYGAKPQAIDLRDMPDDMLTVELAHFVDCIRSGERSSIVTMRDACRGLAAAEAAMESLRTGEVVRPGNTGNTGA